MTTDDVGGLIGYRDGGGSDTESYGFGVPVMGADSGFGTTPPTGVTMAIDLTGDSTEPNTYAGDQWVDPDPPDSSPWDFSSGLAPALKYITGATLGDPPITVTYECEASELPSGLSCGDLLAGQR